MSTRSVAVILICGFTSLLRAQAPPAPPKPGPEHKKLEYFLGKWTVESEIKANEFVRAGKGVSTETCTLGPGGFYVECRAEGQLPTRLWLGDLPGSVPQRGPPFWCQPPRGKILLACARADPQ